MMSEEIVTESGLKYSKIHEGRGRRPEIGETVSVHYELFLGQGTTSSNYDHENGEYVDEAYDSTYDEENPFSGPVDFVVGKHTPKDEQYSKGDSIEGFDEALLDMRPGEKRKLVIPSELAYGQEGASSFHTFHGYRTPPNTAIVCNIELVEIR
jgi:peptidylprolyl isomerase